MPEPVDFTQRTIDAANGGPAEAKRLAEGLYDDLRRLAHSYMRRHAGGNETLQPTAVVNEAFLRLLDRTRLSYADESHFFATAAQVMRHVLVDHARARKSAKRGGDAPRVGLDLVVGDRDEPEQSTDGWPDVEALDEALNDLRALSPRSASVVELRVFAGLGVQQVAAHLGVSERTVKGDWRSACAWLRARLGASASLDRSALPEG